MNTSNLSTRNRATLKLLFVGALSMVMLIPLLIVHSVVEERQEMQLTAEQTIANRWGGITMAVGESDSVFIVISFLPASTCVNDWSLRMV